MKTFLRPLIVVFVALPLLVSCINLATQATDLTITNVRLYPGPGLSPIDGATIAIRSGKIVAISASSATAGKNVIDGDGSAATAGLWNCHVHFTDPNFDNDAAVILEKMLLQYGFTSVIDTGSNLQSTLALAQKIEAGDIVGPRIFTANGSFVYTDGTPSYLPDIQLPELGVAAEAESAVASVLDAGADGIKIFSGSFQTPTETIHLPADIVRAVTGAAHDREGFVISHPTDRTGLVNAIENGVDILAHTAPPAGELGAALMEKMKHNNVALIPTLKLWSYELRRANVPEAVVQEFQNRGVAQLAEYHQAGGEILFGTDVGYVRDFDTQEEFLMMSRAGMRFDDILASVTTRPARRFTGESGLAEVGAPADIVIFKDDPAKDTTGFSRIKYVIRGGRVVFTSNE